MTTSETHARFCFNNWIDADTLTASSSNSSYPVSNLYADVRSKLWRPNGLFEITSTNNKVYINSTTYTLTVGSYTSTTLITHFNSVTSQTLTRNGVGRFVITLGISGTVNFSSTSNAAWSALGFLATSDATGTVFTADEPRYSTGEWLKVDMLGPQTPHFAAIIPANGVAFSATTGTIKLQGNNVNTWAAPEVDLTMEVSSLGAFIAPTIADLSPCRYWRIFINDVKNNDIYASTAYIGDSFVPTNTNIAVGFNRTKFDASIKMYSEGGQLYVDRRPRSTNLSNVSVQYLVADDLAEMEQLIYDLGVGRPFFLCIDPDLGVSTSLDKMTHYVEVDGEASLSHILRDYYTLSINLREVI